MTLSRTTIKDLSKYTSLSLGTISKYINGGNVKPANKKLIDEAIEALHYNVNQFARGLRTNQSRTIGIIIPSLENFFCTSLVAYIEEKLYKHQLSVMVCSYQEDSTREQEQLKFLQMKNVDAIVIVPTNNSKTAELVSEIIKSGTYCVAVDRKLVGVDCDTVEINNFEIAKDVTKLLIAKGHTRIGFLGTGQTTLTAIERYNGYRDALEENELEFDPKLVKFGNNFTNGAYRVAKELLTMPKRPTALFATNYDTTLGALNAINELNLTIPEDVSLVGFDNLSVAQIVKPSLTIVAQPMQEIAEKTVDRIIENMYGSDAPCSDIVLKGYIVYGKSVAEQ